MTPEQKEHKKEYNKQYRIKNKQKIKELNKEYKQTPNGIKSYSIYNWKSRGVIHEDFNKLYELYINTTECMVCNKNFNTTKDRYLDHSHITGEYRNILCNSCNTKDYWKKVIKPPE